MSVNSFVLLLVCMLGAVIGQQDVFQTDVVNHKITFDRVLVVLLENQPLKASLKNRAMRDVLSKGTLLVNYYGLVNPSQPNYIGLIAGDLMGVHNDGVFDIDATNLVDLMEAKNVSWKSYQENYPGNCFAGDTADGLYRRKHNPFISFDNVRGNPERCAKIVVAEELQKDLEQGTVPQYSFYTPNMDNNGHDTGLSFAAKWLSKTFLPRYMNPFKATGNSLLVITFDEGVPGDNQIYTLLIGDNIPAGHIDETVYDHYSFLRLIEENWGLDTLGRKDVNATQITKQAWKQGVPEYEDDLALILGITIPGVAVIAAAGFGLYYYRRRKNNHILLKKGQDSSSSCMTEIESGPLSVSVSGDFV